MKNTHVKLQHTFYLQKTKTSCKRKQIWRTFYKATVIKTVYGMGIKTNGTELKVQKQILIFKIT